MIHDLTEGKPAKQLWLFSMPMLLSVVFQQMYNIVDSVVAGQCVGEDALAAVGSSYPITMIFMAIATGMNIGCSVIISQYFGAKKLREMKTAISTSLISVLGISVVLTIGGLAFCRLLLDLLNTPENIFADSMLYLQVYLYGLVFLFLYNICNGIFTALGDSKTPLYFLIASSLGNIALDLLFVIEFKMGVGGVAWATFLCQGLAGVLAACVLLIRLKKVQTEPYKKFSLPMLGRIGVVAVPSVLQQSFISIGNLCIQGLINNHGSAAIAGYSAAVKLNTFALTSFTTLANGLSSFTAQNIGAGKLERVKQGYRAGLKMGACVVVPFILMYVAFSETAVQLFMQNGGTGAVETGVEFLRIIAPFYVAVSVKIMTDGVLRGGGAMMPFMVATFSDLILRVVLAFILEPIYGLTGIWMSWPIGWVIATGISVFFYKKGLWIRKTSLTA